MRLLSDLPIFSDHGVMLGQVNGVWTSKGQNASKMLPVLGYERGIFLLTLSTFYRRVIVGKKEGCAKEKVLK